MQVRSLTTLTLVAILALVGCNGGNSPEKMVKQQISIIEEFGGVLAKITDKASAEKHKSEVEKVITKMNELTKEMKALPADQQKAGEALADKYTSAMQAAVTKMGTEIARISMNSEIHAVLETAMEKLDQ